MQFSRRALLAGSAASLALPYQSKAWIHGAVVYGWQTVKLGGGGYSIGIDIALDGAKAVKIDVFNGYQLNSSSGFWEPLFTSTNFSSYLSDGAQGVWEIAFAPNNSSRLYAIMNGYLYRRDGGLTGNWVKTALPRLSGYNGAGNTDPNGPYKFANQKMCVDPANGDVIYVATNNNGIQVSFDAGNTFAQVSGITASVSGPGGAGLCFDRSSGTVTVGGQTRTARVIIPSFGNGIWESADGGVTWTQTANGTSSPISVWTAQIDAAGAYWCNDQNKDLYLYKSAAWTKVLSNYFNSTAANTVCVDPSVGMEGRCIVSGPTGGKGGRETLNYGSTFVFSDTWSATYPYGGQGNLATDVPWLATADTSFMSVGDMKFDPSVPVVQITGNITNNSTTITNLSSTTGLQAGQFVNDFNRQITNRATIVSINSGASSMVISAPALANANGISINCNFANIFFAEGIGVWKANWPVSFWPFDWYSMTAGIESLVARRAVGPVGAFPMFAVEDRNVFANNAPSVYPSTYYLPNNRASAWSIDYASSDPTFAGSNSNYNGTIGSALTTNSGRNWSAYVNPPTTTNGGAIAWATPQNGVCVPGNNGLPTYTKNQGSSPWVTCPGLPSTGWIYSLWNNCQIAAADRVNIGTFYLYNYDNTSSRYGIWRSTNNGDTWTQVYTGWPGGTSSSAGNQLISLPGIAGGLVFNPGAIYVSGAKLQLSTNAATGNPITFTQINTCDTVYQFGVGAIGVSGNTTWFIYGKVGGVLGAYKSTDLGVSWIQLSNAYPNNSLDNVQFIGGDMNDEKVCYVGFAGFGFAAYRPA